MVWTGGQLMRCWFVLCLGVASSLAPDARERAEFMTFQVDFDRTYKDDAEEKLRFQIFTSNLRIIAEVNSRDLPYKLAANQFADMTDEEFGEAYAGWTAPTVRSTPVKTEKLAIPEQVDWRDKGAVNPIRDQYQCGACWAFSANAAAESAWALSNGTLPVLSEQQLVDCSKQQGNTGCAGGSMDFAFAYMKQVGGDGLCDGRNYKYAAHDGFCFASECKNHTGDEVTGFVNIAVGDEAALLQAVGTVGVVSVGIQANETGFRFYKSGVFDGTCGRKLDHAVNLVGYATVAGDGSNGDYWILRNSWGTKWGEDGYMRLARGSNLCGVADAAIYPTVAKKSVGDSYVSVDPNRTPQFV